MRAERRHYNPNSCGCSSSSFSMHWSRWMLLRWWSVVPLILSRQEVNDLSFLPVFRAFLTASIRNFNAPALRIVGMMSWWNTLVQFMLQFVSSFNKRPRRRRWIWIPIFYILFCAVKTQWKKLKTTPGQRWQAGAIEIVMQGRGWIDFTSGFVTGLWENTFFSTWGNNMDRGRKAMPVQNKACMARHVQRCQERHQQKVRSSFVLLRHASLSI